MSRGLATATAEARELNDARLKIAPKNSGVSPPADRSRRAVTRTALLIEAVAVKVRVAVSQVPNSMSAGSNSTLFPPAV